MITLIAIAVFLLAVIAVSAVVSAIVDVLDYNLYFVPDTEDKNKEENIQTKTEF